MATIVNTPASSEGSGGGMGFLLGVILIVVLVAVLLYYGVPYLNRGSSGTSVNVPESIDVNVDQPGQPGQ
jgi:hypothetical protein